MDAAATSRSLPDTIVCLPINEWAGLPVNSHHLMREAASRGYRVLYVDPIGLRRPTISRKDVAKLGRLRLLRAPLTSVEPGMAPGPGCHSAAGHEPRHRGEQAAARLPDSSCAARLRADRVLLWAYPPQLVALRSEISCELAIYYRTDDYGSLPGMNAQLLSDGRSRPSRRISASHRRVGTSTDLRERAQGALGPQRRGSSPVRSPRIGLTLCRRSTARDSS